VSGQPDQQANNYVVALRGAVAQVGQLSVNVRDGKVTLDPAAGAQLLNALRSHSEDISGWQRQVGDLATALPLGNNPVGDSMAQKFSQRADGGDTSLAAVLAQYQDAVTDATDAIEDAMRRYADNEDAIGQHLGRISAS
jgi:hypothetical protein